jgi:hypothetical protein
MIKKKGGKRPEGFSRSSSVKRVLAKLSKGWIYVCMETLIMMPAYQHSMSSVPCQNCDLLCPSSHTRWRQGRQGLWRQTGCGHVPPRIEPLMVNQPPELVPCTAASSLWTLGRQWAAQLRYAGKARLLWYKTPASKKLIQRSCLHF